MLLHSKILRAYIVTFSIGALLIFLLPPAVAAQTTPCQVSLSSLPAAPELKGFQLGMTMEQAKAHAPLIVFPPPDQLGSIKTTINPAYDPRADKSKFQDIRTISLDFLDGRLISLWIGYDSTFKWATVEDFVAGISQSLTLPNRWTDWKSRGKELTCKDFQLTISLVAQSPSFRILDTAAVEILSARRTAAAEEAEATETEEEPDSEEIVADRKTKNYYQGDCQPPVPIAVENRATFKTAAEAEKAGYKLARACSQTP